MIFELKRVVQPVLRSSGFGGSFPHYRRMGNDSIDLVTFQFNRHGGSFVIEAARCPSTGITTHRGKHIPPTEVRAHDVLIRKRLRPKTEPDNCDYWFEFDAVRIPECAATAKAVLGRPEIWSEITVADGQPMSFKL
jgi:hypothetical protein